MSSLPCWGEKNESQLRPADYSSALEGPRHRTSPFPCSEHINNRLIIWEGDISNLKVDAITNTTDETLTEKNTISGRIFGRAGSQLKEEIFRDIKECKTGEVRVSRGYETGAKYIIHTVGPIFSERYKTASENTLHSCYR